jgi:ribosomal subunit interface protein
VQFDTLLYLRYTLLKEERGKMDINLSSKTVKVTEDLASFFVAKMKRLEKYSRLGIAKVGVVVDRVKRGKSTTSDATVEVLADVRGKTVAAKDVGNNVYQAFFRAYEKLEKMLRREKRMKRDR